MPQIPFALQWTIPENQLLSWDNSIDDSLRSTRVSNIPEFEYYLEICPNFCDEEFFEETSEETWIFLQVKFKNVKKVEADFTVTIESSNYSYTFHHVYERSQGQGNAICKMDDFFNPEKKYIVDGKFIVKINGIFKFETEDDVIPVAISNGQQQWIGCELGDEFWMKDDTKDFIIITADGNEIKVHKFILENRSDVFTAMLKSNMKEAKENKVEIPDYPFNIVETALKIIYNSNFNASLSMDELMLLLQFFDQYQLLALKAKVEPHLIAQISPSTVCRLTNCSVLTRLFKLKEKCITFLMASFASKAPLDEIDDLDKDVLLQVVKSNFYQIVQTQNAT